RLILTFCDTGRTFSQPPLMHSDAFDSIHCPAIPCLKCNKARGRFDLACFGQRLSFSGQPMMLLPRPSLRTDRDSRLLPAALRISVFLSFRLRTHLWVERQKPLFQGTMADNLSASPELLAKRL